MQPLLICKNFCRWQYGENDWQQNRDVLPPSPREGGFFRCEVSDTKPKSYTSSELETSWH
jgi:hypothetical protein